MRRPEETCIACYRSFEEVFAAWSAGSSRHMSDHPYMWRYLTLAYAIRKIPGKKISIRSNAAISLRTHRCDLTRCGAFVLHHEVCMTRKNTWHHLRRLDRRSCMLGGRIDGHDRPWTMEGAAGGSAGHGGVPPKQYESKTGISRVPKDVREPPLPINSSAERGSIAWHTS